MTEAEWLESNDPEAMRVTTPSGNSRKRRLFACASCRRAWEKLSSENQLVIEATEALADGIAKRKQLEPLCATAYAAYQRLFSGSKPLSRFDRLQKDMALQACNHASGTDMARGSFTAARIISEFLGNEAAGPNTEKTTWWDEYNATLQLEKAWQATVLRDVFGNPFRPTGLSPKWLTDSVVSLAHLMYESRDFGAMPVLADVLQDAGCDNTDILNHCRGPGPHVRGCWVVDLILGKK